MAAANNKNDRILVKCFTGGLQSSLRGNFFSIGLRRYRMAWVRDEKHSQFRSFGLQESLAEWA